MLFQRPNSMLTFENTKKQGQEEIAQYIFVRSTITFLLSRINSFIPVSSTICSPTSGIVLQHLCDVLFELLSLDSWRSTYTWKWRPRIVDLCFWTNSGQLFFSIQDLDLMSIHTDRTRWKSADVQPRSGLFQMNVFHFMTFLSKSSHYIRRTDPILFWTISSKFVKTLSYFRFR